MGITKRDLNRELKLREREREMLNKNQGIKAIIVDTKLWEGHWFKGAEGLLIYVKKYPHKSTIGGFIDACNCIECVKQRLGRTLYETYEVISGVYAGSIIPSCCLLLLEKE